MSIRPDQRKELIRVADRLGAQVGQGEMDQDDLFARSIVLPSYRSGRLLPGLRLPVAVHTVNANRDIIRDGDSLSRTKCGLSCREAHIQLPRMPHSPFLLANE